MAPFGDVQFKVYLFGEILADSYIQLEDIGRIVTILVYHDWGIYLDQKKADAIEYTSGAPPQALKIWFYLVSFLPFWFRMQ